MRLLRLTAIVSLLVAGVVSAAELPLTRVQLFSSGVGYFEREGKVEGKATVEMTFRTAQVNDILKSLVLQDFGGGKIAPVTYAPQDPLARTLGSFALDISDNPSLMQLWERLKGAKVRVTTAQTVEGTAFGTEWQYKKVDDEVQRVAFLNLLTDKGLVQFAVSEVRSIKILDPKLESDLQKALEAIDKARASDRKAVTLDFQGQGSRDVRVGYLLETPVWKTTYRLVSDKDGFLLQGWAIVENTTDDDWNGVNLSLVSGRPVSFIQDLYEPLYLARPEVPVTVAAAARPRVYEGAMERKAEAQDMVEAAPMAKGERGGGGFAGRGAMAGAPGAPAAMMPSAAPAPPPMRRLAQGSADAMAAGGKVGTLFQYAITQPVTIPRQQSAMIPIISDRVEGEKLSVYNAAADPRHPMNGIMLKNTSKLHLMGGPITVFDGEAYGGDALIEDMAPGEQRLLTYAMDLPVEVEPQSTSQPQKLLTAKIVNGLMTLTYKQRIETTYSVKNGADEKRVVLIEHPLRQDWKLIEPKEADERSRSAYRFRVPVEAGKTAKLVVVEELPRTEDVSLITASVGQTRLWTKQTELSARVREALQKLVTLQEEAAALAQQRGGKETRIKEIEQEQSRIRSNMKELDRGSDLYKQYVEKLTKQETEFEALRGQIAELKAQETAKEKEILNYVARLDLR
ncbi:MAG: DUF4139 domain-containing protein [Armatimonadia bacterium]